MCHAASGKSSLGAGLGQSGKFDKEDGGRWACRVLYSVSSARICTMNVAEVDYRVIAGVRVRSRE